MHHTTCLLDLDGTLTDPFPGISRCIAHALTIMGIPAPADSELRKWIGPPLQQSFRAYLDSMGGGDSEHDMLAARFHGTGAIGVLWGYGTPVELLESGAETLVASPAELAEILIGGLQGRNNREGSF